MTLLVLFSLIFVGEWIIMMPVVVYWKTGAKYKIDLSIQFLKVLLVLANKLVFNHEIKAILVTVLMSLFILFIAYQQGIKFNIKEYLRIDNLMKLTLALTTYLGLAIVTSNDPKKQSRIILSITVINLIYLLVWLILFCMTAFRDFKLVFTEHHLFVRNKFTVQYKAKGYKRKESLTFQRKLKQIDQVLQQDEMKEVHVEEIDDSINQSQDPDRPLGNSMITLTAAEVQECEA